MNMEEYLHTCLNVVFKAMKSQNIASVFNRELHYIKSVKDNPSG